MFASFAFIKSFHKCNQRTVVTSTEQINYKAEKRKDSIFMCIYSFTSTMTQVNEDPQNIHSFIQRKDCTMSKGYWRAERLRRVIC